MRIPDHWSFEKGAAVPEIFVTANEMLFEMGECGHACLLWHGRNQVLVPFCPPPLLPQVGCALARMSSFMRGLPAWGPPPSRWQCTVLLATYLPPAARLRRSLSLSAFLLSAWFGIQVKRGMVTE